MRHQPDGCTHLTSNRIGAVLLLPGFSWYADEVRDWIVPVNRRYDLATLTAALEEMFPKEEEAAIGSLSSSDEAAAAAVSHEAAAAAAGSSSSLGAAADVSSGPESERWLPPVEQLGSDAPSSSSSGSSSSEAGKGSSKEGRSLLVEYTMLHGINDTLDDAHRCGVMLYLTLLYSWGLCGTAAIKHVIAMSPSQPTAYYCSMCYNDVLTQARGHAAARELQGEGHSYGLPLVSRLCRNLPCLET